MSKDIVWASNAMINPAHMRPITDSKTEAGLEEASKTRRLNMQGVSLAANDFPVSVFVKKGSGKKYLNLPDLFTAGSMFWVVSEPVAEVLRQHDIGGCNLYPTSVFQMIAKTRLVTNGFV